MPANLDPIMRSVAANRALDRPAELVATIGRGVPRDVARRLQDLLGHPAHPMFTDLPIGFWTSAWFLDLMPGRDATERASRRLIGLGLLSTVPTIASGLGDAADLKRPERRLAAAHAGLNIAATAAYALSWCMRRKRTTPAARAIGHIGAAFATAAAAIGGHLAFPPSDTRTDDSDEARTLDV